MHTPYGHLTYCTNIHAGESWADHFAAVQQHVPLIKKKLSPEKPFGIGLRLSNEASIALGNKRNLKSFKDWLQSADCYVFTMNGFPYGGFHNTTVKDKVHAPDWSTMERVDYTIRLAHILTELLPDGMEGGISTSPLSYRHWHATESDKNILTKIATKHVLDVAIALHGIKINTGKTLHLDIEPEPDGMLETGNEFIQWYMQHLLPTGVDYLKGKIKVSESEAVSIIKEHVQLCYDVCHFAIGFEDGATVLEELNKKGIKVGKIQISAALKGRLTKAPEQRKKVLDAFAAFNEATYLHQVVAMDNKRDLKRFTDLPQALETAGNNEEEEWRAHFHVPLFIADYGSLQSTRDEIEAVLNLHKKTPFTKHLEIETYTWEVLPQNLKAPLTESIIREIEWVQLLLQAPII